ncbi:MAG: hypothetical protein H8E14_05800 [Candidatus Marinimicrobia bacterium]|nr:hypothetical protein [Candidatus Neomarinimicrobiota bacterium]
MEKIISLIKYAGIVLISMSMVLFWSCEDEADTEDGNHPQELVGTWYLTGGESFLELTSNSDQTGVDLFSEAIGSIDLSGEATGTMTYMIIYEEDGTVTIALTNQLLFGYQDFPLYAMNIYSYGGWYSAYFTVFESEDSSKFFITDSIDLSFDINTYTLTINSSDLMKWNNGIIDSNSVVTVSGTLQSQTFNLTANTPMQVGLGDIPVGYMGSYTIILEANGNWQSMIPDYDGDTEIDTSFGTWDVDGSQLIILEEIEDEDGDYIDTFAVDFTLSGNTLTLNMAMDMCEEDEDYPIEECFEEAEMEFALDPGSLIDYVQVSVLNFSQTAPVTRIQARSKIKYPLQLKMFQDKRVWQHPFR